MSSSKLFLFSNKAHLNSGVNANMADHSVVARDESHESDASQALMFCFDSTSPGKSCFLVYRGIHADVIVYIFVHLHMTLCTEGNMLATKS